eukprot:m.114799 g.114799  ORF g.114799 m.114799 type:complete len:437 (+) comp51901_c0_seq4:178-1488(+)
MAFVTSGSAWLISGIFAWLSILITAHGIYAHLRSYTNPSHQLWIVRILFMVPIYAFASWMSLHFYHSSLYFDVIRDCYEAFVIYTFLALCFEYLGGEAIVLDYIKGKPFHPSWKSGTCCIPPFQYSHAFLRFCKRGTLQFCVIKPVMAVCIIVFSATGYYEDGDFHPDSAYPFIIVIYNVSISVALYALVMFYSATKEHLRPYEPLWKFVVVKSVIFLSFWQSIVISILQKAGAISDQPDNDLTAGELAVAYQNFIICIEMFFAALAHRYAFSATPYEVHGRGAGAIPLTTFSSISSNLRATLNPSDIIDETIRNFSPQYETYVRPASEEVRIPHEVVHADDDDDDALQHMHPTSTVAVTSFGKGCDIKLVHLLIFEPTVCSSIIDVVELSQNYAPHSRAVAAQVMTLRRSFCSNASRSTREMPECVVPIDSKPPT